MKMCRSVGGKTEDAEVASSSSDCCSMRSRPCTMSPDPSPLDTRREMRRCVSDGATRDTARGTDLRREKSWTMCRRFNALHCGTSAFPRWSSSEP